MWVVRDFAMSATAYDDGPDATEMAHRYLSHRVSAWSGTPVAGPARGPFARHTAPGRNRCTATLRGGFQSPSSAKTATTAQKQPVPKNNCDCAGVRLRLLQRLTRG